MTTTPQPRPSPQPHPSPQPSPPSAEQRPHWRQIHGDKFADPYAWLRDREDPAVIAYLDAENAYTAAMTAHTAPLRDTLYREMRERIQEDDGSVPVKIDDWYYGQRTVEGGEYPIYYRNRADHGGQASDDDQVILDLNALAAELTYLKVGDLQVSPDHRLLAYTVDSDGSERFTLYVKDLTTGQLLADRIEGVYYTLAWGNDSQTVYYTVADAARRPHRAMRHRLGQGAGDDQLLHQEDDERLFVRLDKTRSRKYVLMTLESHTTSVVYCLDADRPDAGFVPIVPRQDGVEVRIEHHSDWFYALTNAGAVNFKVVRAPVTSLPITAWDEVIPHEPQVRIEDIAVFERHLVVCRRVAGLERLQVHRLEAGRLEAGAPREIAIDEADYGLIDASNPEFTTSTFRYALSSLKTPPSVFDYDMDAHTSTLRKRDPVPGGYDPAAYVTARIEVRASDGALVPVSLIARQTTPRDGSAPCLLSAYGAYGINTDPSFAVSLPSLLDRGFVYAVAHIRGGSALGRPWYDAGKLRNKRNTFTDFIAVAEHLIAADYTSSDRLAIRGGSAGGLLMGAVANLRPDLFAVIVAAVPFVDVVTTMLDPSLPLTVIEWEEWGNPTDKGDYDYIRSYSPYDNVVATAFPTMLITAGLNDPRVGFWEPAKWTAKLRALKTDANPLLLKTEMSAGHHGKSGRFARLEEAAFTYAFLIDQLPCKPSSS